MFRESLRSIAVVWRCAKLAVIALLVQSLLTAVLTPLSIYFTQQLIDHIQPYIEGSVSFLSLLGLLGLLLLSVLFLASNGFFNNLTETALRRGINKNLTTVILQQFRRMEYRHFEDADVADTLNRMGREPQERILEIFLNTIKTLTLLISMLGTALVFMQVSVWFLLIFLLILGPMMFLDYKSMDTMNSMFNSLSEEERKLNYLGTLLNDKHSLLELKLFGAVSYILNRWKKINKKVLDEHLHTTLQSYKYFALSVGLIIAWVAYVTVMLIRGMEAGTVTLGLFAALIEAMSTVVITQSPQLSSTFSKLSQQHLLMRHYRIFLGLSQIKEEGMKHTSQAENPCIVFEDVHFAYPKTGKEILKGVNLTLTPGQRVALVGENGAGKSTIIKLLCRLYQPTSGRITLNGTDINELSAEELRKAYSVVFQDYGSYTLTLRENVAFGDIEKLQNDEAIKEALHQGLADGVLERLGNHLDANLGKLEEDGTDLSGGQWQRLAIARACLSDSAFVILDEPTAALDPIAESEMYQSFAVLLKQKGCLMISHRLASAKLADRIYVLQDGLVAESGSHEELMSRQGLYERMFTAQSSWYQTDGGED